MQRFLLHGDFGIKMKKRFGRNDVIEDGKAKMISADCPDQLCVHQSSIAKSKETIVCLPNKVVVEVQGSGDKKDYDAVVK